MDRWNVIGAVLALLINIPFSISPESIFKFMLAAAIPWIFWKKV